VDEGPAAHLDQRILSEVIATYKERVRATILAPFLFWVRNNRLSLYISIH
jgi:hypothetical protein